MNIKKSKLKNIIRECILEILGEEGYPYDPQIDTFAAGPRDRTEPSISSYQTPTQMWNAVNITHPNGTVMWLVKHKDGKYLNKFGLFVSNPSEAKPFSSKGAADEFASKKLNLEGTTERTLDEVGNKPNKISNGERNKIGMVFKKAGLDGNGRFEKKEAGLAAVTTALSSLGFSLDMVTGDMLMGDQGSRNFIYRRKNAEGQDPFTEGPEITNSRIVFNWTLLAPGKFEILAYAS
jgi:hypothetical protein